MNKYVLIAWTSMLAFLCSLPALAVAPNSTDARAIMDGVFDRETGDRLSSKMVMVIEDKSGRKSEKTHLVYMMTSTEKEGEEAV